MIKEAWRWAPVAAGAGSAAGQAAVRGAHVLRPHSPVVVALGLIARRVPMAALLAAAVTILALPGVFAAARDRFAAVTVAVAAVVLVPLLVIPTYLVAHPQLHVDNATDAPIDLWIDGVRTATIAPR